MEWGHVPSHSEVQGMETLEGCQPLPQFHSFITPAPHGPAPHTPPIHIHTQQHLEENQEIRAEYQPPADSKQTLWLNIRKNFLRS